MRHLVRVMTRMALARISGRSRYQGLFETLHGISLRGMNYGSGDLRTSGERLAMRDIARAKAGQQGIVVFDVGANVGAYAEQVAVAFESFSASVAIHAFEPAAAPFALLGDVATRHPSIRPRRLGFGDRVETRTLYYDRPCSPLGSLLQRDLRRFRSEERRVGREW